MARATHDMRSGSEPRVPIHRLDAVAYLSATLVAIMAIESRMVVGPLGGAGTPAQLLALFAISWWLYHHVQRTAAPTWAWQPVRLALLALFLAFCTSHVVALSRPIDGVELSSASLGMVSLGAWLGIALLAHDGIPTEERLDTLLRRLVIGTAALALLGIAQFLLHDSLIRWISIPGLRPNVPLGDLMSRSGFTRPAGTALHPIEFGAVLTTVLPLAIARARIGRSGTRLRDGACVFLIGLGVVVSGSRSALLCGVVGLAVLAVVWSPRTRAWAGVSTFLLLAFVAATLPGMTGTFVKLFTGLSGDGSVQSRIGSYDVVGAFFGRAPLFGRGYSTFLPRYRILDNQYLLLLVEVGLVGLLAFICVLGAGFWCARASRRHACSLAGRERGQALAAAIASASVGFGTYDGLSFPMATAILFLVVGIAGASWRLARTTEISTTGMLNLPSSASASTKGLT